MLQILGGGMAAALAGGYLRSEIIRGSRESLPYVVLIVLDGARREYFDVPGIPTVRSLIRNGTHYTHAFAGILESETPSGHTAIGTGSEPRLTGIPSFWWVNSDNVEVDLFNPAKIRDGDMERIIRQSRVPTLAGLVHGMKRSARVVALSGSKYYAADAIGGPEADVTMYFDGTPGGMFVPTYVPGHAPPPGLLSSPGLRVKNDHIPPGVENHLAMRLATDTFNRMQQHVTLINLPEFDWPLGHVKGGTEDPAAATFLMQSFDRDLRMLQNAYRRAGVLDRTLFVLMADHGMMPLSNKVVDTDFTDAVSRAGTGLISSAYTSGVYLWLQDADRVADAATNIAGLRNPHIQSVYARLPSLKRFVYRRVEDSSPLPVADVEVANQYLLNTFNGPNAPDIVVAFKEGVGCEPGGQSGWKADHGGTSWQSQQIPLILSGPGIRSGVESSHPARLIDVAPTVLSAMGVPHWGMQGLPLADAMETPSEIARARLQAVQPKLRAVVDSLKAESQAEVALAS